jgi:hypothetical protein
MWHRQWWTKRQGSSSLALLFGGREFFDNSWLWGTILWITGCLVASPASTHINASSTLLWQSKMSVKCPLGLEWGWDCSWLRSNSLIDGKSESQRSYFQGSTLVRESHKAEARDDLWSWYAFVSACWNPPRGGSSQARAAGSYLSYYQCMSTVQWCLWSRWFFPSPYLPNHVSHKHLIFESWRKLVNPCPEPQLALHTALNMSQFSSELLDCLQSTVHVLTS